MVQKHSITLIQKISKPGTSVLITSANKETLVNVYFNNVRDILWNYKIEHEVDQKNLTIKFPNGSVVYFKDMSHHPSDVLFNRVAGFKFNAESDVFIDDTLSVAAKEVLSRRCLEGDNFTELNSNK